MNYKKRIEELNKKSFELALKHGQKGCKNDNICKEHDIQQQKIQGEIKLLIEQRKEAIEEVKKIRKGQNNFKYVENGKTWEDYQAVIDYLITKWSIKKEEL